jgi:hypothetical protein
MPRTPASDALISRRTLKSTMRLHPIVEETRRGFQNHSSDRKGRLIPHGPGCLDISVGKNSIPRALRILDSLTRLLEKRGWTVSTERPQGTLRVQWKGLTKAKIHGESVQFWMQEVVERIDNEEFKENPHSIFPFPLGSHLLCIQGHVWLVVPKESFIIKPCVPVSLWPIESS